EHEDAISQRLVGPGRRERARARDDRIADQRDAPAVLAHLVDRALRARIARVAYVEPLALAARAFEPEPVDHVVGRVEPGRVVVAVRAGLGRRATAGRDVEHAADRAGVTRRVPEDGAHLVGAD